MADEYGPGEDPTAFFYTGGEDIAWEDQQIALMRDSGLTQETAGYNPADYQSNSFDWGGIFKTVLGVAGGVASAFVPKSTVRPMASPAYKVASATGGPTKFPSLGLPGFLGGGGPGGSPSGFGFALSPMMILLGVAGFILVLFALKK